MPLTTPTPQDHRNSPLHAPVGIVGAGPVGLVAALRLASFGIPTVILDAKPGLVKQGSKACLIQGDALEVLDKIGCADTINAEGITWTVGHTYVRNREIRTTRYERPIGFGPFVNISQHRIEQVLAHAAAQHQDCDLRWNHLVTGVAQDETGVDVQVTTPEGERTLRFGYLVACDGVRSTLRDLVDVEWTGYSHGDRFLITDIKSELPFTRERHFHYDPPFNPGRQVVIHPQPNGIWRIDWQLPPDADIDAERADGRFEQRVKAVIGDRPFEVDWISVYRFRQRVVDRFRVGRVMFAGDAAHSFPPYGSRGMNSGIQDADNLAWKLAPVITGKACDDLLNTYHDERYAAAKENLRVTEATITFMVPPTRLRRFTRWILLYLSHSVRAARDRVNSGRMAEPYVYRDSPIVQRPGPNDTLTGAMAPDSWVTIDGARTRLRRTFGRDVIALVVAPDTAHAHRLITAIRSHPANASTRIVTVIPTGTARTELPEDITLARADDHTILDTYLARNGRWWLVRPDGYLAGSGTTSSDFTTLLHKATLPASTTTAGTPAPTTTAGTRP